METRGRLARIHFRILQILKGTIGASRAFGVSIGNDCRILSNIVTTEPWLIEIGDRVTVSSGVLFVTHDGSGWLARDENGRRYRYAPIRVGSDVFIGTRATIMPGVTIGDRCVVAAGSIVTRDVADGTVVGGVPAKPITTWDDLHSRMLAWPSERDKRGTSYRERVDSIVSRA